MRLETDRLALRPLAAGDLDALTDLDGDPEVLRFVDPFAETPVDRAVRRASLEDRRLPRMLARARRPGRGWRGHGGLPRAGRARLRRPRLFNA